MPNNMAAQPAANQRVASLPRKPVFSNVGNKSNKNSNNSNSGNNSTSFRTSNWAGIASSMRPDTTATAPPIAGSNARTKAKTSSPSQQAEQTSQHSPKPSSPVNDYNSREVKEFLVARSQQLSSSYKALPSFNQVKSKSRKSFDKDKEKFEKDVVYLALSKYLAGAGSNSSNSSKDKGNEKENRKGKAESN